MPNCTINHITELTELFALRDEWDSLHKNATYSSLYNSFDFIYRSFQHFLSTSSSIFTLVIRETDDNQLVAIFPLQIAKHAIYGTVLSVLEYGACDEADKPYPIFAEGTEDAAWKLAMEYLWEQKHRWDFIEFMEIREDLPGKDKLIKYAAETALVVKANTDVKGPIVALDGNWEDFWNKHKKMRQKVRAMEKKFGEGFRFEACSDPKQAEHRLEEYIALEQKSWKAGKLGISKNPKTEQFYRDFYQDLAKKQQLHFGYVYVDDVLVSGEIAYSCGDIAYFSHGCYHDEYKKFSPGMVSTSLFIKYFLELDFFEGDFLSGFAHYLNPWSKKTVHTERLSLYRLNANTLYVLSMLYLSQTVYRPIKNALKERNPK